MSEQFIQAFSGIFRNIHHYSAMFRHVEGYEGLLSYIQALLRQWSNIQAYSELCVTLPYSALWHIYNLRDLKKLIEHVR